MTKSHIRKLNLPQKTHTESMFLEAITIARIERNKIMASGFFITTVDGTSYAYNGCHSSAIAGSHILENAVINDKR